MADYDGWYKSRNRIKPVVYIMGDLPSMINNVLDFEVFAREEAGFIVRRFDCSEKVDWDDVFQVSVQGRVLLVLRNPTKGFWNRISRRIDFFAHEGNHIILVEDKPVDTKTEQYKFFTEKGRCILCKPPKDFLSSVKEYFGLTEEAAYELKRRSGGDMDFVLRYAPIFKFLVEEDSLSAEDIRSVMPDFGMDDFLEDFIKGDKSGISKFLDISSEESINKMLGLLVYKLKILCIFHKMQSYNFSDTQRSSVSGVHKYYVSRYKELCGFVNMEKLVRWAGLLVEVEDAFTRGELKFAVSKLLSLW